MERTADLGALSQEPTGERAPEEGAEGETRQNVALQTHAGKCKCMHHVGGAEGQPVAGALEEGGRLRHADEPEIPEGEGDRQGRRPRGEEEEHRAGKGKGPEPLGADHEEHVADAHHVEKGGREDDDPERESGHPQGGAGHEEELQDARGGPQKPQRQEDEEKLGDESEEEARDGHREESEEESDLREDGERGNYNLKLYYMTGILILLLLPRCTCLLPSSTHPKILRRPGKEVVLTLSLTLDVVPVEWSS